jgi:mono/diheme cytochrome c family protein
MRRYAMAVAIIVSAAAYLDAAHTSSAQVPAAAPAQTPTSPRAVVDRYCVTCHNARLKRGDLVLEGLDIEHLESNAATWEKVVKKVQAGVMPPAGSPRPAKDVYQGFLTSLEQSLDRAATTAPNPGRPAVHRLNRAEYTNAVRDLLALDIDGGALLPADNSGYGFDNVADVLTVSPGLLERYILAAKKISRLAIGDPKVGTAVATYDIPYMTLLQDDRVSEDLPFGSRGVSVRHYFPTDGNYEIKLRLQRNSLNIGNEIRGLEVQNQIDVRLDGVRLKVFTIGGRKYSPGTYTATEDIADSDLKLRVAAKAGSRTIAIALNKDDWYVEGVGMSRLPPASDGYASGRKTETSYGRIDLGIDRIEVTGPFDATVPTESDSRHRIFVCHPAKRSDEDACAKTILSGVARRAYRRQIAPADVDALLAFYKEGRANAGTFDDGIEKGLVRILTDPEFLFRVERDPAGAKGGAPYRISDFELASRLSFFLWSSIPDDPLLDVAASGTLSDPKVFEAQVGRMLADRRARALLNNFFGQWLLVRNMATVRPDPKAFPDFDENLRLAFEQETRLFLESQLRDDRPVTEILTANYTFVNERLAQHYGIANVYGTHFRRVTLPDGERAGLLSQGSVLTVTSYADRTSVVLRGKFILESILGTPPPPPPPVVPPLENTKVEGSLRQRMEQHRSNPICANCHAQIDPMGFALENFDGIGKWRTTDGNVAIDASGALPDGTKFNGPAAFRQALMQHQDAFMNTLTEKLLTYALGRGMESYDMPTVRSIIGRAAAGGNTWSALILNVTKSLPFQMRRTES